MTHNLINYINNLTGTNPHDVFWVGDSVRPWVWPDSISREIDKTFDIIWKFRESPIILDEAKLPKTNIKETKDGMIFECFVPLAKREDIQVTLDPLTSTVKIEVESHQEKEENGEYHLREISRSSFKRTFAIDKKFDIRKASADFKDGILTLEIPISKDAEKITLKL